MMGESTVKLTIALQDSDLEEEELYHFGFWILDFGLKKPHLNWVLPNYLSQTFFELVLDKLTKNLLQEIKDLDDVENPCLEAITQTPQRTKLFGSFYAGDVAG